MYNVAFVYTEHAGAYKGVIFSCSYPSKEEFEKTKEEWKEDYNRQVDVLEEGISEERCTDLAFQTPETSYITVAVAEVVETAKSDGSIDLSFLDGRIRNAISAIEQSRAFRSCH